MSSLLPDDPAEIIRANSVSTTGTAEFKVDPSPNAKLEVWESISDFNTTPRPAPTAIQATPIEAPTHVSQGPVPIGGLYEAFLYRSGGDGALLGKLAFPCLKRAAGQTDFLTRCARVPQLEISPGGTFLRFVFAASVKTRARVQIGTVQPELDKNGFPGFPDPNKVVASAVSGPGLVHQLSLVDELTNSGTTGRTPLQTGQELYFVILAWDEQGNWDAVWNRQDTLAATKPEIIKTKQRSVAVRLERLTCLDDSDDLSDGEAEFTFRVRAGALDMSQTIDWKPMETGSTQGKLGGKVKMAIDPPNAANGVSVRIEGVEDDSGSFPPDDDDKASPQGIGPTFTALKFPAGDGKEVVTDQVLVWRSQQLTFGERLSFEAEVHVDVTYV